jgi:hypothetical protein
MPSCLARTPAPNPARMSTHHPDFLTLWNALPSPPHVHTAVMEYCDCGTLRQAVHRGTFHRRMGNAIAVDFETAIDVSLPGGGDCT